MRESRTVTDTREAILDARQTVAADTVLSDDFKRTADEGLSRILMGLDEGNIPVERAVELGASLMRAVLLQRQHTELQATSSMMASGTVVRAV